MRLLIIIPELSFKTPGGIATFYRNLIPGLREHFDCIDVLVANQYENYGELWSCDGVNVSQVPEEVLVTARSKFTHLEMFPTLAGMLSSAWAAYDYIQDKERYDLVNVIDWGLPFVPWLLDSNRPPVVVAMHGSSGQISLHDPIVECELEGYLMRLLEKTLLPSASGLLTFSQTNKQFWTDNVANEVRFILPPLAASRIIGADVAPEGLVIGRLQKWKDPYVVCRALELLSKDEVKIRWVGRETSTISKERKMGEVLSCEFPQVFGSTLLHESSLPYEEVRALQSSSAFNLISSSWDVFNFTAIESLLSGRPTICSSGAGASSLIRHGESGFVFPAQDAQALASLIEEVLNLPEVAVKAMAEQAYQTVESELDPKKIAGETASYFAEIVSKEEEEGRIRQDWISDFVSPNGTNAMPSDTLENIPLKDLISYVGQRCKRKLFTF
jgi:glycosyltransferase involved in cell wall biosynthesis